MIDTKAALAAGFGYLRRHPEEFLRVIRNAYHWKFGIPVDALQWLASEITSEAPTGARDIAIQSSPPGLRIDATVEQMGTLLRGSCVIVVERVTLRPDSAKMELRLREVQLKLIDESAQTPLAALVRSGTLDLSRVASLVAYLPSRPAALVEAVDDRLVVDLMKMPVFAANRRINQVAGLIASLLAVDVIKTESNHLDVGVRPFPNGLGQAPHR